MALSATNENEAWGGDAAVRRHLRRWGVDLHGVLRLGDALCACTIKDISPSGARIVVDGVLGTSVGRSVQLLLPDFSTILSEIRHIGERVMGLMFLQNEEREAELGRYLVASGLQGFEERSPTLFPPATAAFERPSTPDRVFTRTYQAGQTVIRQGERGRSIYLIERGRVKVTQPRGGVETVISELGAGDIFGEMSMIDDAPRSASVIAAEECELIVIQPFRLIERLTGNDPLVSLVIRVLLSRFRWAEHQLVGLAAGRGEPDRLFDEIRRLAVERINSERDIHRALEEDAFEMHYQPIFALSGVRVAGFEALIRWRRDDGVLVLPGDFIPRAEESGLIVDLGRWSVARALEDHHRFVRAMKARQPDAPPPFMSINFSALQLADVGEIDRLMAIVERSGTDPRMVKLEITESLMMADPEHAAEVIRRLKQFGISIAIDDFGTGYSSLSYLHRFPLDTMKIDRAFLENMETTESGGRLLANIVRMALELKLDIVAEGIETAAHADALRALGCEFGQGYYLSRPQTADRIVEFIGDWQARQSSMEGVLQR